MGKIRAGDKRKREQTTDFMEAVYCPSAGIQGQHSKKIKRSARNNWDPQKVQQPFQPNPNEVGDRTTTLRRLLFGAGPLSLPCLLDSIFPF